MSAASAAFSISGVDPQKVFVEHGQCPSDIQSLSTLPCWCWKNAKKGWTFLGGILHPCEFPLKPISSEKLSQQLGSQAEQANPIVECESGKSMEMIKSGWKILKQGFSLIAVNISISFSNIHSTGNPLILQHSHKLKIEKGSEKLSKQYCNLVKSIIVKPS